MATDWEYTDALKAFESSGALDVQNTPADGQKVAQNTAQQSAANLDQSRPVTRKKQGKNNNFPLLSFLEQIAEAGIEPARPLRSTGF